MKNVNYTLVISPINDMMFGVFMRRTAPVPLAKGGYQQTDLIPMPVAVEDLKAALTNAFKDPGGDFITVEITKGVGV